MKTLDLSAHLEDLDGAQKSETLGRALAASLVNGVEGPAIKFYDWGVQLHRTGIISVDNADMELLKEHVSNSQRLPVWVKAPILRAMKESAETPSL
jgi:hypothetical protein